MPHGDAGADDVLTVETIVENEIQGIGTDHVTRKNRVAKTIVTNASIGRRRDGDLVRIFRFKMENGFPNFPLEFVQISIGLQINNGKICVRPFCRFSAAIEAWGSSKCQVGFSEINRPGIKHLKKRNRKIYDIVLYGSTDVSTTTRLPECSRIL